MIRPVNDYILVELDKSNRVSQGGIVIPGRSQEPIEVVKVIATADREPKRSVGDLVYIKSYDLECVEDTPEKATFLVLEDDVMAVWEEE